MDLSKIAQRIASEMPRSAAYPEMEVANMESAETLKAYDVVIRSGKLRGKMTINAESPEDAEQKADEEIEGMGWDHAGVVWTGYDPEERTVLDYETRFLDKNFAQHGYDTVSVKEIGPAFNIT